MIKFLFYAALIFCTSCGTALAQSSIQKIYLNPKSNSHEKQSTFIDSIRFIPLEIKEDIEFNKNNVVQVANNHLLIYDHANRVLLLYTKTGQFIKSISYKKLGDSFYPRYNEHINRIVFFGNNKNYTLTPRDRIKILLQNNPRHKKYFKKYYIDLNDSSFAIRIDMPQLNDLLRTSHLYDDYYWQGQITTSELYTDSLYHELNLYQNDTLVKSYFPYNRINEPKFLHKESSIRIFKTDTASIHFISRPYCDTLYKIIGDSIFPVYQLVLPLENSLPETFFTVPFKNKSAYETYMWTNGWKFRQIFNFYETPLFIFFSVSYLTNLESYIYQKKTGTTFKTKNVRPDSTQYNLKILTDFGITNKNDRLYRTQNAGDLLTFFSQNKNVPIPEELENFFKSKPHDTSPIIIEFKLKTDH